MNELNSVKDIDFQNILSNPILDIGARFWEKERYETFKICYHSMRAMDDLVDDRKVMGSISKLDKKIITSKISKWIDALSKEEPLDSIQENLLKISTIFQFPLWPWRELAKSMIYDLHNDGFEDFQTFLEYSEGAAVSPGAIFMHLAGLIHEGDSYCLPNFDIRETARPLAIFCYMVHVIRDFQKDQNNNLNYLPISMMVQFGLTQSVTRKIAAGGEIPSGFRMLVEQYQTSMKNYQAKVEKMLKDIQGFLTPRYHLSLVIIYNLYLQIFERIDINYGSFSTAELNPSPQEVHERINQTIDNFEKSKMSSSQKIK